MHACIRKRALSTLGRVRTHAHTHTRTHTHSETHRQHNPQKHSHTHTRKDVCIYQKREIMLFEKKLWEVPKSTPIYIKRPLCRRSLSVAHAPFLSQIIYNNYDKKREASYGWKDFYECIYTYIYMYSPVMREASYGWKYF